MKCKHLVLFLIIGVTKSYAYGQWFSNSPPERKVGEVSLRKCEEFSKIERQKCHRDEQLIVGGKKAKPLEFPHMAAILNSAKFPICGGTLISPEFVLTAAHCLSHRVADPAQYVKLGVNDIKDRRKNLQQIKIAKRIPHPEYNYRTLDNDIALLRLKQAVQMNRYARPACLYTKSKVVVDYALATGWGLTSYDAEESSQKLMKVKLKISDSKTCKNYYKRPRRYGKSRSINEYRQLCAGYSKKGVIKDTCQGDSGGPLQIYHLNHKKKFECMYEIIGITSFGKPGCNGKFGVYTKVSNYIKWIENIVWPGHLQ